MKRLFPDRVARGLLLAPLAATTLFSLPISCHSLLLQTADTATINL